MAIRSREELQALVDAGICLHTLRPCTLHCGTSFFYSLGSERPMFTGCKVFATAKMLKHDAQSKRKRLAELQSRANGYYGWKTVGKVEDLGL